MMKNNIYWILFIAIFLVSCKTQQKSEVNYMQNIEQIAEEISIKNAYSTIQSGDQLIITVAAKDMDLAKPFNQNYSSGQLVANDLAAGNVLQTQTALVGPTYIVDANNTISFPYLGTIDTKEKTTAQLTTEIASALEKYIKFPMVTIKNANYKIVILGEVNKPGTYIVADSQATLLSALGLAGDLTIYGQRNDVLVVRNVDGKITQARIDITKSDFISSPYYYLKQNDVITVNTNRTKELSSKVNPNTNIYIAIAGTIIAATGIIVTVLKN